MVEEKEEGWQLMLRNGRHRKLPTPPPTTTTEAVEKEEEVRTLLFTMESPTEAAFLIGTKGRNVALIRKHSSLTVRIEGMDVWAVGTPQQQQHVLLACRMALSACVGGVLRWFVTPQATRAGYPETMVPLFQRTAAAYRCDVAALRSHKGHMCVLLLPQLQKSLEEVSEFRTQHLPGAREAMLAVMRTATTTPSTAPPSGDDADAASLPAA